MPQVSVILPVYNGAAFLKEAIDSILAQTFTDFELIIINDGSTDNSEQIILSYEDPRIKYLKNDGNKGLVCSLNKAVYTAQGTYIARMDADDIALPQRLEKQVYYLNQNKEVGILSCTITMIDDSGAEIGFWPLDRKTISHEKIKRTTPRENCIAHPTIIGRRCIFLTYAYDEAQKNIEDYDLWLRLLNVGIRFEKIPETLLLYRVHKDSITQSNKVTIYPTLRVLNCKKKYLKKELRACHFSSFNLKVAFFMVIDWVVSVKKTLLK